MNIAFIGNSSRTWFISSRICIWWDLPEWHPSRSLEKCYASGKQHRSYDAHSPVHRFSTDNLWIPSYELYQIRSSRWRRQPVWRGVGLFGGLAIGLSGLFGGKCAAAAGALSATGKVPRTTSS